MLQNDYKTAEVYAKQGLCSVNCQIHVARFVTMVVYNISLQYVTY